MDVPREKANEMQWKALVGTANAEVTKEVEGHVALASQARCWCGVGWAVIGGAESRSHLI